MTTSIVADTAVLPAGPQARFNAYMATEPFGRDALVPSRTQRLLEAWTMRQRQERTHDEDEQAAKLQLSVLTGALGGLLLFAAVLCAVMVL